MPTISVIVPVYKVEPYLDRCVKSILAQTYTDFELILVDDGSPDNCPAMCDAWAEKDSRIVVIHQANGGLSAARNAGIDWAFQHSNSEWLTFIDSDDWVQSEYLAVLYQAAIANGTELSACEVSHVTEEAVSPIALPIKSEVMESEFAYSHCHGMFMIACAKLYRKPLWNAVRFPIGKLHEDAFTAYKVLFDAQCVAICDTPLYYYYQNLGGIMNSPWTPKRLDEVAAHEEQMEYMKKNGYKVALKTEKQAYCRVLARHIVATQTGSKEHQRYVKPLRRKLKNALLQQSRKAAYPIQGNEWVYEAAFPVEMRIYWVIKAIQRKFLRLFCNQ